jgi:hypothetical protein
MLSLDLFDSKYERELHEGAVDKLEARRIDTLNDRMQDLLARAKEPAYKKNPAALAGLKKQYQQLKDERDSYYKVRETQQSPTKGQDLVSPQQRVAGATPAKPGMSGAVKDVVGGVKRWLQGKPDSGPTYEDQATANPRALGVANFQRLVKANMGNIPTVSLEFIRPEENFKLDQKGLDVISDYYDGLENDQAKNYFIYRVLPSGEETLKVLKQLGWNPQQVQQELPGIPTQGELPLSEKKKFEKDSEVGGDVKVTRELQKLRAQYPTARNDLEAVAQSEIDSTERSQQQLAAIRGANQKQDALLKQLVALDQEQGREIDGLDQENNSLEKRLAQVQSTNDRITSAITQMTGTKKAPARQPTDVEKGGIIDLAPKVTPSAAPGVQSEPAPKQQKATAGKSPAIASMAQQIQGLNKPAPGIRPAPGIKSANEPQAQAVAEHGGGIGPKQHWQDLMPEQSNPEDDDWYDDEDQDTELRSGDYVRDTMDGEHGEIFRMQGDPYERRVRILDRDGKGWYIEPSRLTRVDPQDPDVQRYFGRKRVRDMDESANPKLDQLIKMIQAGKITAASLKDPALRPRLTQLVQQADPQADIAQLVATYAPAAQVKATNVNDLKAQARSGNVMAQLPKTSAGTPGYGQQFATFEQGMEEGWSDAMVARRTGQPRTPYSVYINGKKWKDFENDDHAEAVANKLRAKFKAEGRDPGVITIAPTDMSEGVAEAVDEKGALKSAQAAAKFIIRNLDDRAALKDYSMHFWSPEKFYQGATMAMRGAGLDEIVRQITQDRPAQFETKADPTGSWVVYNGSKVKRFKTHGGAKAYAEKAGGKVASSEHYQDKIQKSGVDEAIVASGPSKPLDDRAIRKMVWDTMKINADTGEQALQRALAVLAKKPQSRMVQDLQDKFQNLADRLEQGLVEGLMKEPTNRKEYLDQRDKLFRMMAVDSNPANKQIIKQALQDLEARYGNLKNAVREESSTSSEAVEIAIIRRVLVAHTDLIMEFGLDKVTQAIEEVAYNVGDADEIGTSDVSAYVHQVKQILGVPEELDEKWSQKYKSSINCANPKGFSQKAHCAGKKK